jgi:hypothetical protein
VVCVHVYEVRRWGEGGRGGWGCGHNMMFFFSLTPPTPFHPLLFSWAQLCQYHLVEGGRMLDHDSHWVGDGVCVKEK